jgi:hypothetical protein
MLLAVLVHSDDFQKTNTTSKPVLESCRPSADRTLVSYEIWLVMENDQYQEAPFSLTTSSSRPRQSRVGCYTPVPRSPDLLARHQRLPTSFRLLTLYLSLELLSISLRLLVRWADVSSTRPVERVDRHSDAPGLDLLIWASMHPELAGMSELLRVEVSHVYQNP